MRDDRTPNAEQQVIRAKGDVIPMNDNTWAAVNTYSLPPKRASDEKESSVNQTEQRKRQLRPHHLAKEHALLCSSKAHSFLDEEVSRPKRLYQRLPLRLLEVRILC
jgi:hypothetical protein